MFTLKSTVLVLMFGLAQIGLLVGARPTATQQSIKSVERLFGQPLREHPYLFEINEEFVLKVDLDKSSEISNMEVLPKYFFESLNPEWKEPDHTVGLSNTDYVNLLSRLAQLKPFGAVISQGKVGAVTNSKLWLLDEYQNAFIQRRLNRTAEDTANSPETMNSFSIYYVRNVEGVVDDKRTTDEFGTAQRFRVKISGCSYLTSKQEFAKAKKGERAVISAAGPLDDTDCSTLN